MHPTANIWSRAFASFALRVFSVGILFTASIVYARLLGADGYGVYAYVSAWIAVLGIPAGLGTREFLVRQVAVYSGRGQWLKLQALTSWALRRVMLSAVGVICVIGGAVWILLPATDGQVRTLLWALPLLPLIALTGVRYGVLRGLDNVVAAMAPESVIRPVVQLGMVLILWRILEELAPWHVMSAAVGGAVTAFLACEWFYHRNGPTGCPNPPEPYNRCEPSWLPATLRFMVIAGLYLLSSRIDILMLGALKSTSEAGIYAVASYGAEFVTFALIAVNTAVAPNIAKLWSRGDIDVLQRLLTHSVRTVFFFTFPIAFGLIFFSDVFLSAFGSAFVDGSTALTLLCIAQALNAAMGSVGLVLNMSGHERLTAWGVGFAVLVNVLMNALLIPRWGMDGAAVATLTSLIVWNLSLVAVVRRRTGLRPTIFGV